MAKYRPELKVSEAHRETLIANGLAAAEAVGYQNVNRAMVCDAYGIARAMVNIHIGSLDDLRLAIQHRALIDENIPIIAQMLVFRDPFISGRVTPELMAKVIDYLKTA